MSRAFFGMTLRYFSSTHRSGNSCGMADHGHITMSARLGAQNTEPILGIMKGDAFRRHYKLQELKVIAASNAGCPALPTKTKTNNAALAPIMDFVEQPRTACGYSRQR
jgi:hypothetical protein